MMSMFGMFLFASYYLQLVKGSTPLTAGLVFVPLGAAQAFGSMVLGTRLTARMRPGLLMFGGYLVTGAGVLLLALLQADSSYGLLVTAEIVTGLGIGTAFMPAMSLGTHGVAPPGRRCREPGTTQRPTGHCRPAAAPDPASRWPHPIPAVPPPGLLLGITPDGDYLTTETPLPLGSVPALATDGLIEAPGIDTTTPSPSSHATSPKPAIAVRATSPTLP
ncbi:SpoIIE family protein phosphatase [Actinacidiphila sp. bgisy160]|uniref:SpoIIE family protein phosphatase n=1 Tax=Actinacidiphila sp. bgisy160 TaxID=3413796 RepID=UPI003D75AC40